MILRRSPALTLLACVLSASGGSRADDGTAAPETSTQDVQRCVDAHETARLSRLKEDWPEAREAMTRCADAACPLAIRSDCGAWLDEVERLLPTLLIVIERDDDAANAPPVQLTLDGSAVEVGAELRVIKVLPGTHQLRFDLPGYPSVEREISVAKGEKNRVVRVRFARERPSPPPPRRPAAVPESTRPIPTSTYLLAGGALAVFTASGVLLGSALSSLSSARDTCSPECPVNERESIETTLLVADILGGTGVVLGGLALYTFVTRPVVLEPSAAAPKLELARGRALISVRGEF